MASFLEISPLGLGCATFGREIDEACAREIMEYAWARGLAIFDTASAYGGGASESIVGNWLASREAQDRPLVATKILPPYTAEGIARSLEDSLRRLRLRTVPLLYLHRWDASLLTDEPWIVLQKFVREGVVQNLGASNFSFSQLKDTVARQKTLGFAPLRALQNNHNFAVREVDDTLGDFCVAAGIKVVTFSPLGAGFLTGKHSAGVEAQSRFALIPGHQDIYFQPGPRERLEELQGQARQVGKSSTELALIWALHQAKVNSVLIGARRTAHIDQALAAASADPALLGPFNPRKTSYISD